jgi:hypothetical protein
MALQPEDESKTGTLPDPELNPLLNPLLAANMGRWAEVYFTNPPEKRAQAVAELLRELEKNPQPERHSDPIQGNTPEPPERRDADALLRRPSESSEGTVVCAACGRTNSTAQKFCGMCGMPLPMNEGASSRLAEHELARRTSWHDQKPSETEIPVSEESPSDEESTASYSNLSIPSFASLSPDSHSSDADGLFHYESRPAHRNFRLYIGIGIAIVLGLLVYKTWRGNASFWANHTAPAALPSAAPVQSAPAVNPTPAVPPPAEQNANGNVAASEAESAPPKQEQAPLKPTARKGEVSPTTHPAADSANPANAAGQSGAAELAVGEKYLNGRSGTARDSREAASWLWKAVAKKNPTATVLLSDLYLRGDGVAKSCDQARLLLDAAAKTGNAAAAERLRNLPAFGCQ